MAKKKKKYNPMSYVKIAKPAGYVSPYESQLGDAMTQSLNFKYDPMQDANYQALAKIYGARGNQAAKDTLGDAAALNGGFGTSYAVSAAQQARNQYNQELAGLIPDLEANAYNRVQNNYNILRDADTDAYGKYRDLVADYQWGKGLDMDIYAQKKSRSGGGGGGRRSSGGGGGYSSGGYSSGGGGSVAGGGGGNKNVGVDTAISARSALEHMNKMSNADLQKNGGKQVLFKKNSSNAAKKKK